MKYKKKTLLIVFILTFGLMGVFPCHGSASSDILLLKGQSVYVPIYSHIYHGDKEKLFDLAAILSIRNIDPKWKITLISADYLNSDGDLIKKYITKPLRLKKLATIRFIIKSSDKKGGSGAKFIVRWVSKKFVNPPLIEAIMISTRGGQGVSFISRGEAIKE